MKRAVARSHNPEYNSTSVRKNFIEQISSEDYVVLHALTKTVLEFRTPEEEREENSFHIRAYHHEDDLFSLSNKPFGI